MTCCAVTVLGIHLCRREISISVIIRLPCRFFFFLLKIRNISRFQTTDRVTSPNLGLVLKSCKATGTFTNDFANPWLRYNTSQQSTFSGRCCFFLIIVNNPSVGNPLQVGTAPSQPRYTRAAPTKSWRHSRGSDAASNERSVRGSNYRGFGKLSGMLFFQDVKFWISLVACCYACYLST
jgi:hypothetical protein